MLKRDGSPEYTFGVKNNQKSELRALHKFEQAVICAASMACGRGIDTVTGCLQAKTFQKTI